MPRARTFSELPGCLIRAPSLLELTHIGGFPPPNFRGITSNQMDLLVQQMVPRLLLPNQGENAGKNGKRCSGLIRLLAQGS
jgi:hypothetical protein